MNRSTIIDSKMEGNKNSLVSISIIVSYLEMLIGYGKSKSKYLGLFDSS